MKAKFYSLKELAALYDICIVTLRRRIEPFKEELNTIGIDEDKEPIVLPNSKQLYSPKQIKLIFSKLGDPTKEI